jgi:methylenetetrahydrofolate reductase (NADPH)
MSTNPARSSARHPCAWHGQALPEVAISFEFFPPKNTQAEARLWEVIERLAPFRPSYVSVTCGAAGNPAEGTASLVDALRVRGGLCAAAHLTCATAPCEAIDRIAEAYWSAGVRHIVALRGDSPKQIDRAVNGAHYRFAVDLVAALRRIGDFEISVAAYPEPHPEAISPEADFDNLRRKIDAGADRAITQYCFDTDVVLRLRDRMVEAKITAPLSVGILPVHNFTQVRRFSERCGAGVPDWLADLFEGLDDDPEQQGLVAASVAAEQARRLIVEGIKELHFYTLNRAELTIAACRLLGLRPSLACAA